MNEKLTAYVLNELPPDERAEFEAQMKTDPALREQAEEMKTFCAMLSNEMAAEESPALTAQQRVSVMRAFTAEVPEKKIVRPFWRHPAFFVPTAIAACVAFAMVWDTRESQSGLAPDASQNGPEKVLTENVQVTQGKAVRKTPAISAPKPTPTGPEKPRMEIAAAPAPALPAVTTPAQNKGPAVADQTRVMQVANSKLKPSAPAAPAAAGVPASPPVPTPTEKQVVAKANAPGKAAQSPPGRRAADIIVLKTGEKIDAMILSETDTTLTYKYKLTAKIWDTKTIHKADIKELARSTPAQVELAAAMPLATATKPALQKEVGARSAYQDNTVVRTTGQSVLKMQAPSAAPSSVAKAAYASQWLGTFTIRTAGTYRFSMDTAMGCRVFIDGRSLLPPLGLAGGSMSAAMQLAAGVHDLRVEGASFPEKLIASMTYAGPDTGFSGLQEPSEEQYVAMNSSNAQLKPTEAKTEVMLSSAMARWTNWNPYVNPLLSVRSTSDLPTLMLTAPSSSNSMTEGDTLSLGRAALLPETHLEGRAIAATNSSDFVGILGSWANVYKGADIDSTIHASGTGAVSLVMGGNIANAPSSVAPAAPPLTLDAVGGGRPPDDPGTTVTLGLVKTVNGTTAPAASGYSGVTTVIAGTTVTSSNFSTSLMANSSLNKDGAKAPSAAAESAAAAPASSVGLTKAGAGTLVLSGNNTGNNSSTGITVDGDVTIGSGAVTKTGNGTWTLNGANTYRGYTTVNGGVLRKADGVEFKDAQAVNSTHMPVTESSPMSAVITANGVPATPGFRIVTSGDFTTASPPRSLNGANSYGGPVSLDANARPVANAGPAATAPAASVTAGKDLALADDKKKENTWGGSVNGTISGTGGVQTFVGAAAPATSPPVALTGGGTGDITVTGGTNRSSGTLAAASSQGLGVTVMGAGKLTMSGTTPNTYTGATTVNQGTLRVGNSSSATPSPIASAQPGRQKVVQPTAPLGTDSFAPGTALGVFGGAITADGTNDIIVGTTSTTGGVATATPASPPPVVSARPNLQNGIIAGWASTDAGASLELQGGITVNGEALTMNSLILGGAGDTTTGAAPSPVAAADHFAAGQIIAGAGSLVRNDVGKLEIANSAGLGAVSPRAVTVNAGQALTIDSDGILAVPAAPQVVIAAPLVDNPTVTIQIAPGPPSEQELLERERARLAEKDAQLRRHLYELEQRNAEIARRESSNETYTHIYENPFLFVARQPLSTFSIDVDSASYANVRRFLNNGQAPPPDAVRLEELINYFPYAYEGPSDGKPFGVMVDVAEAPWQPLHRLVRVALKGREVKEERGPANFVFLVDVSGSMSSDDKLPLVKKSLEMLTRQLGANDRVAMVVYAGSSGLVLPSTPGSERDTILNAIGRLQSGGSTNGAGGITQAYQEAAKNFVKGGVNRVILCTDGDFNVGISTPEQLEKLIAEKAKSRIFLSVLGFGTGNLKDRTMETLADKGNGNYAYIDSLSEARKVLVEQMNGTLVTIAKDVKIQVEFNPTRVAAYRLLGYENRLMAKEDFNNDKKDAGEIGAGHTVTALYEVVPATVKYPDGKPAVDELKYAPKPLGPAAGLPDAAPQKDVPASNEMMTVKLRYKQPEGDKSDLLEVPVTDKEKKLADSEKDFQFAASVAGFGMLLRGSQHAGDLTWDMVREMALSGKGEDKLGYRGEFLQLIDRARGLTEVRR